jgi:hypothetical protein
MWRSFDWIGAVQYGMVLGCRSSAVQCSAVCVLLYVVSKPECLTVSPNSFQMLNPKIKKKKIFKERKQRELKKGNKKEG